jgi:hypothetical protein
MQKTKAHCNTVSVAPVCTTPGMESQIDIYRYILSEVDILRSLVNVEDR